MIRRVYSLSLPILAALLASQVASPLVHVAAAEAAPIRASKTYSTSELLQAFLGGSGPVLADHPDLRARLHLPPATQDPDLGQKAANLIEKVDLGFTDGFQREIQSRDPYRVNASVVRLNNDLKKIQASASAAPASAASANSVSPQDYVYAQNNVAVVSDALQSTEVVTTFVVGAEAGVLAAIIAVFFYQRNPHDNAPLQQDRQIAALARLAH